MYIGFGSQMSHYNIWSPHSYLYLEGKHSMHFESYYYYFRIDVELE
jgi:hypothetical protein